MKKKELITIVSNNQKNTPIMKEKNEIIRNNEINIQKPFLKWVGGKTQMINTILDKIPKEMNNYHELFLGGGSVLLGVLSLKRNNQITIKNKIYAYDVNTSLIQV